MTTTEAEVRQFFARHSRGESWSDLGWYPPVPGWHLSGQRDPEELRSALNELVFPDREKEILRICPWIYDTARRIAAGDVVRVVSEKTSQGTWPWDPPAGQPMPASATVFTRAAWEALTSHDPGRAGEIAAREAKHARMFLSSTMVDAYLTSREIWHLAALAVLRHPDDRDTVIVALWDEARQELRYASKATVEDEGYSHSQDEG